MTRNEFMRLCSAWAVLFGAKQATSENIMKIPSSTQPIPIIENPPTTAAMSDVPFDPDDPRGKEPLVELRSLGLKGANYYSISDGSNAPYFRPLAGSIEGLLSRTTVASKLVNVDRFLASFNLSLWIFDAYRPIATQQGLWAFFREKIAAEQPGLSDAELDAETRKYVSDPSRFNPADARTWPLHSTGGAVDLLLAQRETGHILDFGAPFDDMTEVSQTDHFERLAQRGEIAANDERLLNRRILYWAMSSEGFTNYAYEFWHFDWGDKMHVVSQRTLKSPGPAAAWYGYVPPADVPRANPEAKR